MLASISFSGVCAGLVLACLAESASGMTLLEWLTGRGEPGSEAPTLIRCIRNLTVPLFDRKDFDPSKVQLVDKVGNNVIIRTSNPLIGGRFAKEEFFDAIQHVLQNDAQIDIPIGNTQIIVFNLMHRWAEYEEYTVEKSWFDAQMDGEFRNYPQLGSLIPASLLPSSLRHYLARYRSYPFLPIESVVEDLRREIMSHGDKPKVILVHCVKGQDRTGMVIGDYQMTYMGKTYEWVMRKNAEIAGGSQDYWTRTAMQWMALYHMLMNRSVGSEHDIMSLDTKTLIPVVAAPVHGHHLKAN